MFIKRTINSGTYMYFQGPTDTRDPFVPIPTVRDALLWVWEGGGYSIFLYTVLAMTSEAEG
jgi:hypothetical protein